MHVRYASAVIAMTLGVCVTDASVAQTVDLGASTCFQKPPESIHKVDLNPSSLYTLVRPPSGHTYDYRGEKVERLPTSHLFRVEGPNDVCIVGPTVIGTQSRSLTWEQMKDNYDKGGINFGQVNANADLVLSGARIVNVEDGVMFPRPPEYNGKGITWRVENTWMEYIRDDAIENDSCLDGTVKNVLVDRTQMGFAARPSRGKDTPDLRDAKWVVEDTLVHLACSPDSRSGSENDSTCPAGQSVAQLFKQSGCSGSFTMKNTVLRVDAISRTGRTPMRFAPGTYENVTLVWLGPGDYPATLPKGVTQTKDVGVWNRAREEWLKKNGCDDRTKTCTMLTGGSTSAPVGTTSSSTTTTTTSKTTTQTDGCS